MIGCVFVIHCLTIHARHCALDFLESWNNWVFPCFSWLENELWNRETGLWLIWKVWERCLWSARLLLQSSKCASRALCNLEIDKRPMGTNRSGSKPVQAGAWKTGQTDKQRQTNRQTSKQEDKQTNRDKQTNQQAGRQTDKQRKSDKRIDKQTN